MGIYFNPGNEAFRKDAKSEIYIDKTGLINVTNKLLNEEKNCISVSHARRFGKSQAARMLKSYYSRGCDSKELFSNLEISKSENFETHLNKYNTIHLDISSFEDDYKENIIEKIKEHLFAEIKAVYPDVDYSASTASVLNNVYLKTVSDEMPYGIKFVIIIDEWDCIIRNYSDSPELVHKYMKFLHALFKSEESKSFLGFGYITGIMPIKKIKNESALNNFMEYTMISSRDIKEYYGFTEKEVDDLCEKYDMSSESVKAWYNGYLINGKHMYNPNSVVSAVKWHSLESYWKNTSSFESINTFITLNFDGLKEAVIAMLNDQKIRVNVNTFQNDLSMINSKDDALTALIHLGYLGYDAERGKAFIPNYEVKTAFQSALETKYDKDADAAINQIKEKRYSGALKGYKNEILLVGINYNKDKHHECVIESITPEW